MAYSSVMVDSKPDKQPFQLLLSVVRSLSASEDDAAREEQRKNLDKEFQKSDAKLNSFVASGESQIRTVMQTFSEEVGEQVNVRKVADELNRSLIGCKARFREHKDHVRQLYQEGEKHDYYVDLLNSIIWLKESPRKVDLLLKAGKYEEVAERLVAACKLGEGPLNQVDSLRDVQAEVNRRRSDIQQKILADLHSQLYEKSIKEALDRRKRKVRNLRNLQPIFQGSFIGDGEDFKRSATAYLAGLQELVESDTKLVTSFGSGEHSSPANVASVAGAEKKWEEVLGEIAACLVKLGNIEDNGMESRTSSSDQLAGIVMELGNDLPRKLVSVVKKIGDEIRLNPSPKVDVVIQCCNGIPGGSAGDMVIDEDSPYDLSLQTQVQVVSLVCPPLIDFFSTVFHAFHAIAMRHKLLLEKFSKASKTKILCYDDYSIWFEIQNVVKALLTDYLDLQNFQNPSGTSVTSSSADRMASNPMQISGVTIDDVNSLFVRKRTNVKEVQEATLFSFDNSVEMMQSELTKTSQRVHFVAGMPHNRMMPRQDSLAGEHILVCPASPKNIALLYHTVSDFVGRMEAETCETPGSESSNLTKFVKSCIENVLIPHIGISLDRSLDRTSAKSPDIWREVTTPAEQKKYRLVSPVLRNTVVVVESIKTVMEMVERIWLWRENFAEKTFSHLKQYFETCQAAFRGLTQPESEDKRIKSAVLAQDDDLIRRLKSFPNWTAAQRVEAAEALHATEAGKKSGANQWSLSWQQASLRLDMEELWQREADILLSMSGGLPTRTSNIAADEIISDASQLRSLALLEESMAWFSNEILVFVSFLGMMATEEDAPDGNIISAEKSNVIRPEPASGKTKLASYGDELKKLAVDFQALADTCLMVLHLEVRVRCMYFLFPLITGGAWASMGDRLRVDEDVVNLNTDLHAIHEALVTVLPPNKNDYVLGGLGQMMSTVLVRGLQCIPYMESTGIRRMSRNILSLHQNLCNLTQNPELALDRARLYYEMLHLSPHEILARIRQQGPKFTEAEYLAAFNVLDSGRGISRDNSRLRHYKSQLSEILGEVGVTV